MKPCNLAHNLKCHLLPKVLLSLCLTPSLSHCLPRAAVSPTAITGTPGEVVRRPKSCQLMPEELYMCSLVVQEGDSK